MIDDSLFDIPVVLKVKGVKGDKGDNGIPGRDGVDGKDGADGENGVNGKDGKNGRDGLDGKAGKDGIDGKSAYQLWLTLGNNGSVEDFVLSLRGDDGISAYDIWLGCGHVGSQDDFLQWLRGKDGVSTYQNVGMSVPDLAGQVGRLKVKNSALSTDEIMIRRAGSLFRISHSNLLSDYIPYTGATQPVDLGSQNLITAGQVINRNIQSSLSCGVHEGMEITINADPTKINIASGSYTIVDCWTDPQVPVEYNIEYAGATGVTVTNLSTADFTYILIDKDQTIIQLTTFPSDVQHRNAVTLAQLGHTSRTSVASVNPQVEVLAAPIEQLRDYWNFFAIANKGNIVSANGANLSINKSIGYLFSPGSNFYNEPKDPNVVEISATVPSTFRRRTQTGAGATGATTLDVGNYDVAGTITATTGVKYTNQRAYLFPNGNLIIQYGQTQYTNMSNAIAAIPTEPFIVFSNIEGNAAFIGVISVRSTATDLSDSAQAIFTRVDALTGFPSGSSGTSTTTLQQAYENSNANPEILTDSTGGAVTIRRGSAADTDDVLNIQNNAGSSTFSVKGDGGVTIDSTTSGMLFSRMTTTQKNAISSPTGGLVVYDTTLNKLCVYTTAWETITSI